MLVFRGVPERATTSAVLTIGNFDGVHRGHRALLAELTAKARELAVTLLSALLGLASLKVGGALRTMPDPDVLMRLFRPAVQATT